MGIYNHRTIHCQRRLSVTRIRSSRRATSHIIIRNKLSTQTIKYDTILSMDLLYSSLYNAYTMHETHSVDFLLLTI